ncbi:PDZ domain-containing protein [Saccharothrix coeruleofusca]|uniref:YlbL family protein n=1 Tax=Saccharothrix coeruleofusca TaxID=33919 RepID=UPI0027DAEBB8|nr:PDZ domain-containing protein [Saccharothrix coeruleofusca]MBP2333853.1 PDZ domain-containing protein [Saccharothrix coeruleofusca]
MSDTAVQQGTPPTPPRRGLTRRTWTLVVSLTLVLVLGVLGGFARVPYVALGPGPTYDTLGQADGTDVVEVEGQETFPTGGRLTMTTVSLTDDVSLFGALGLWLSGRYALAPREEFFRPGESEEQVRDQNTKAFEDSQTSAEVAALRHLGYPVKVVAAEITKGSAADNVIQPNDRLLEINGKPVTTADEVRPALETTKPGDQVEITFQHEQDRRTARVTLGRAEGRDSGFLGLLPVDRADVPFEIKISLNDVGGPSAGLMFALSIVDKLTPGELNGGQSVAGTGEINEKGEVGRIGGIAFKMVAAREGGATTFLVPAGNCDEARQNAPEGLRLVKVEKLDDAVRSLESLAKGGTAPTC